MRCRGVGTSHVLPHATDRATALLAMHGGGYEAALAGLPPAVPSHARRDYVVGAWRSTDVAIVSRHVKPEAVGVGVSCLVNTWPTPPRPPAFVSRRGPFLRVYERAFGRAFSRAYERVSVRAFVRAFVRDYERAFVTALVRAYVRPYLRAYVRG